ncbi:TPA: hypothetical protein ACS9TY_004906 [Salmonella enterica subsp. enterica serovar Typhi]
MTDTAFSKSLRKEVDPEQYLVLKNLDDSSVHAVAREDIICPTGFVMSNYIEFKTKTVRDRAYGEAKFLAFAALLLFVSDWDLNIAIGKFSKIARVKEVDDMLAGNFIGLNPYFRYDVAKAVKKLQDNWPIEYQELEHWDVEKSMRESYEKWRSTEPEFAPPLLPDLYVTQHEKEVARDEEIRRWIKNGDV